MKQEEGVITQKQEREMGFAKLNPKTENETDTICGTEVWHLGGVNIDNMAAVMRTNAWIHYSDLADDGWGLVCNQAQAESWQKHFRRSGISIETWPELPYTPWTQTTFVLLTVLMFVIALFVMTQAPLLGIFSIFGGIALISFFGYLNKLSCRHIRFAAGLKAVLQYTIIKDNFVYPPTTGKE